MPVVALQRQLDASLALRRLLRRELVDQMRDAATAAACLRLHPMQARRARWPQVGQDLTARAGCWIPQEALASLLGMRLVRMAVSAR